MKNLIIIGITIIILGVIYWILKPIELKGGNEIRIWAIGDGVRVNPETGKLFEDNPSALPKCISGDYKNKNWVWDSADKIIKLHSAKNEVVAFQLIIEVGNKKLKDVSIKISDLIGKKDVILNSNIELFREWYVHIIQPGNFIGRLSPGWYPDPLIPFDAPGYGAPFNIPSTHFIDTNKKRPRQKNQAVWVDVYVPKNVSSGKYKGTMTITATNNEDISLNLELNVYNFTLPDKQHIIIDLMNNYSGDIPDIPGFGLAQERKYYQLAQSHRVGIGMLYISPKVSGSGIDCRISDWTDYDLRMKPYLSGSLFTKEEGYLGPGENTSVSHIILPFETLGSRAWPMAKSYMHTDIYEIVVKKAYEDFERHFDEKGWNETELIVFYNGYDEPSDYDNDWDGNLTAMEEFKEIKYLGQILKKSNAKRIKYRIDLGHLKDIYRMPSTSNWNADTVFKELGDVVDIWNVNGGWQDEYALFEADKLRERVEKFNEDAWFYNGTIPAVGANVISGEGLGFTVWSWIVWKYGLTGWCMWHCTKPYGKNPYYDGNDHGVLYFYPGNELGLSYPIPCIRLKSMRRGAQDYEYMWLLTQKNGGNRTETNKIVDTIINRALDKIHKNDKYTWSHNPMEWFNARIAMAEKIDK